MTDTNKNFTQQLNLLATLSALGDDSEDSPEVDTLDALVDDMAHGAGFPGQAMGNDSRPTLADGPYTRLPVVWLPSKDRGLTGEARREIVDFIHSAAGRYVAVRWTRREDADVGVDYAGSERLEYLWDVATMANMELVPARQHGAVPCNPKASTCTWDQAAYAAKDPNGGRVAKHGGHE